MISVCAGISSVTPVSIVRISVEESKEQVNTPERKRMPVHIGEETMIMDSWSEAIGASGFHLGSVSRIFPPVGILCSIVNLVVSIAVSATRVELEERLIAAHSLRKRYLTIHCSSNSSHEDVRRLHVERVPVSVACREHERTSHGGAWRGRKPEHIPLEETLQLSA